MGVYRKKRVRDGATVFRVQYTSPEGERITEVAGEVPRKHERGAIPAMLDQARALLAHRRAEVRNGTWCDPHAEPEEELPLTFGELVERFLQEYTSRSGKVQYYRERAGVWLRLIPPETPLSEVSPRTVERFRKRREREKRGGRSLSPSTVRKDLVSLSCLFRWALVRELVSSNPADSERVKRPSEPRSRADYLSGQEEAKLLESCPPWLRRVVRWAIGTGMDRSEVLSLSWSDVDRESGTVYAPRSKTGVPRNLPLNDSLRELLQEAKRARVVVGASSRVFLGAEGEPVEPDALKTALRRAYNRSGIGIGHAAGRSGPFKVFRHTFASRLAMAGVSAPAIARLMGHTTQAVTDRYMHLSPSYLREAMGALDRKPSGPQEREELAETVREPSPLPLAPASSSAH